MKPLVLFIFMLASASLMGQARLGFTPDHLRQEYSDPKYELCFYTIVENNVSYATVEMEMTRVYHFFKDKKKVHLSMVEPKHEAVLQGFIRYYNDNYVILSTTHWQAHVENGTLDIKLEDFEGISVFVYTLVEED